MKKVIAFTIALGIIALCYCAAAAATNDYIWSQKPASGPLVSRNLTPTVGRIIGFPTSINSPETIIIGSGLTLTGTTLTASGSGTVTSVALSAPSILSVSGSPVTTSGTLALSLATQAANIVFAGPATGADAAPTFRALVAADIPSLSGVYQPLATPLTNFSALANAAGVLTNNGSGTLSYTATSFGGGYTAEENKIPMYSSTGGLTANALTVYPEPGGTFPYPFLIFTSGGFSQYQGGSNGVGFAFGAATGFKTITFPAATGTVAVSASGNIALSAAGNITFTGTLPVANGGTGITSLGTGVAPWLGTPTIANLNTAVSDANLAITGANTFNAAQMIDGSADAVQLTVQGHSTQTDNILLVEKSDGTDLLTLSNTGAATIIGTLNAGSSNTASGTNAIALGSSNTVSAVYGVALGSSNINTTNSGVQSNVVLGQANYVVPGTNTQGIVVAGLGNVVQSTYHSGLFVSGAFAYARHYGERLHGFDGWAYQTPAQIGETVIRTATTNATATEGFIDGTGGSKRFTLLAGQTYDVEIKIVARKSDGSQSASYWRRACIQRTGTTTALAGTVQTIGTDIEDDAAWDVAITANDTNDALKIEFTGAAATNIRWMARLDFTELNY